MIQSGYRDWLEGSNHPLNASAKLNSNVKIRSKWTNEYNTIKRTLRQKQQDAEDAAEAKRLQDEAEEERLLQAYLHQKDLNRAANHQKRKRKKELLQMEKEWVAQKMAANEAWVNAEAQRTLNAEVQAECERIGRARNMQSAFDRKWTRQRRGLLMATTHFEDEASAAPRSLHAARDFPGESKWRRLHGRQRLEASYSTKAFLRTAPFLSEETPPLATSAIPRLENTRHACLSPGLPWSPPGRGWAAPTWRVMRAGTRSHSAVLSPMKMPTTKEYEVDKVIKVGHELSKTHCAK